METSSSRFYASPAAYSSPAASTLPAPVGITFARSFSTCAVAGSDSSRMSDSEYDHQEQDKLSYGVIGDGRNSAASPGSADLPILIDDSDSSVSIRRSIDKMLDEQEVFGGSSSDYDSSSSSSVQLVVQRRLPSLEYPIFTPQVSPSSSYSNSSSGFLSSDTLKKSDQLNLLRRIVQDAHESSTSNNGFYRKPREDTPFPANGFNSFPDAFKRHR
jgi:hypothetical protein